MDAATSPVAGRLKRPSWRDPRLLIGVALVIVALVGTAAVVSGADRTEPFYAARDAITPGTRITVEDLVVVHVRVDPAEYAADAEQVVGMVATRVVDAGELVPLSALGAPDAVRTRSVAVTTTLPLGQEVERGSVVDVWVTQESLDGQESEQVASGVLVEQVVRDSGAFVAGGTETVYVLIPEARVGDFLAELASDGDVAVVSVAGGA